MKDLSVDGSLFPKQHNMGVTDPASLSKQIPGSVFLAANRRSGLARKR